MPRVGSPNRAFRLEDIALWDRFGAAVREVGTDRSAAIRDFIRWYTREPGAKLPRRPEVSHSDEGDQG